MSHDFQWLLKRGRSSGKEAEYIKLFRSVGVLQEAKLVDLEQLVALATETSYRANELLLSPVTNSVDLGLQFIKTGRVAVWRNKDEILEELIKELSYGEYLGETVLLEGRQSPETYQALTTVTSIKIGPEPFERWVRPYFELATSRVQYEQIQHTLEQLPVLRGLPTFLLKQIASYSQRLVYSPNVLIIQPGEQEQFFYFVVEGEVDLWGTHRGAANPQRWQALRQAGDFFGSPSLLFDMPNDAIALTRRQTQVIRLSRTALEYLTQNLRLRQLLKRYAHQLYKNNLAKGYPLF